MATISATYTHATYKGNAVKIEELLLRDKPNLLVTMMMPRVSLQNYEAHHFPFPSHNLSSLSTNLEDLQQPNVVYGKFFKNIFLTEKSFPFGPSCHHYHYM